MKTFKILTFAAAAFLLTCCNGKKTADDVDERFVEKIDEKTGVASLSSYTDGDTISINGKLYKYTYDFHDVDSLPHVVYASGTEYRDNEVKLVIKRDSSNFVEKTFTKGSFKSYVPEKLYQTSGLIGFTYNIDRRLRDQFDALYFIATIGNLDDAEEIAYPLEIRIDTDGGMTIKKYEDIETEPLRNGLTVDPSTDDGV